MWSVSHKTDLIVSGARADVFVMIGLMKSALDHMGGGLVKIRLFISACLYSANIGHAVYDASITKRSGFEKPIKNEKLLT